MNVRTFSVEELIRLAHRFGLITSYTMRPDRLTLERDGDVFFQGDPVETRFFLMGLITEHTRRISRHHDLPAKLAAPLG